MESVQVMGRCETAVGGLPWSRAIWERASARTDKNARSCQRDVSLRAFAASISESIDWTAGDSAICLARQAGPGPRI